MERLTNIILKSIHSEWVRLYYVPLNEDQTRHGRRRRMVRGNYIPHTFWDISSCTTSSSSLGGKIFLVRVIKSITTIHYIPPVPLWSWIRRCFRVSDRLRAFISQSGDRHFAKDWTLLLVEEGRRRNRYINREFNHEWNEETFFFSFWWFLCILNLIFVDVKCVIRAGFYRGVLQAPSVCN